MPKGILQQINRYNGIVLRSHHDDLAESRIRTGKSMIRPLILKGCPEIIAQCIFSF